MGLANHDGILMAAGLFSSIQKLGAGEAAWSS